MGISSYVYHFGLKAGVPFPMLKTASNIVDVTPQLGKYFARKRAAADLLSGKTPLIRIDPSMGYHRFEADTIPSLAELTRIGKAVYERNADKVEQIEGKTPITHLMDDVSAEEKSEIARLGSNRDVAEIMCDYFKTVPRFDNADIWISRPNSGNIGSQLFHLDKPDRKYTSIFLNISPVTKENGPLQLLSKKDSDAVRKQTRYERSYYHGDGRLTDDQIAACGQRDNIVSLVGPEGSGGLVDTSECIHSGSRCMDGVRVVMILSYMLAHKPGIYRFSEFAEMNRDEGYRQLMLS